MTHPGNTLQIHDAEEVTITRNPKSSTPVLFYRCGQKGTARSGNSAMDMMSIFENLNKGATWLFWRLAKTRNDRTNVALLRSSEMSPSERGKIATGFKELHGLGVLKRTKQNHYLINPKALLPRKNEDFPAIWAQWEKTE